MSLQEVVDLARSLPRPQQFLLIEQLRRDPCEPSEDLLKLIPKDFVAEFWHADAVAGTKDNLVKVMEQMKKGHE